MSFLLNVFWRVLLLNKNLGFLCLTDQPTISSLDCYSLFFITLPSLKSILYDWLKKTLKVIQLFCCCWVRMMHFWLQKCFWKLTVWDFLYSYNVFWPKLPLLFFPSTLPHCLLLYLWSIILLLLSFRVLECPIHRLFERFIILFDWVI